MMNMLFLSIQFISILAFGMFWYKVLKWSPEESVCMAIISAMTLILVGGFCNIAHIALVIIYVLSFIGIVMMAIGDRNNAGHKRLDFFSPGIIILVIVFLYGAIAFSGLFLHNWDEMHQWGKSVNFMLNYNALPHGDNFNGEEILLSSTTAFHYYFCKFPKIMTGEIVESNMYVSNLVLWFSGAILPLSNIKWKNWMACFSYAIVVFLSMNVLFVQPYYNIYCDQPVTIWAGGLIAWNIFCKEKKFRQVFIVLTLLQIALMKNMMGPLFVAVVVLSLFIKYVVGFQKGFRDTVAAIWKNLNIKNIIYSVLCVISVFLYTVIWSMKISDNALVRGDGIIKTAENRLKLTLKSGITKWFQPVNLSNALPNLTFFLFLFFSILIGIWFSKKYLTEKQKKQYQVLIGFYVIGFFAFFAVMMYAYLTTFSYADSIVTGSLNRYLSDYMMLGVIPLVIPAFLAGISEESSKWHITVGATILLVFFGLSTTNGFLGKSTRILVQQEDTYKEICKCRDYKSRALSLMDTEERIYMVNQNSNGGITVAADYVFDKLLDRSGMCYYFTNSNPNIAGLSHINIRALPEVLLAGYGYLWIYKTDDYFNKNAFGVLKIRTPENGDFYKVINHNGKLDLEYLGNLNKTTDEE